MRLNTRMIATAAFAVLLMSTLLLHAEEAAKSSAGAGDDKAVDSSVASSAGQAVPMPAGSTMGTAMPYSGRLNIGFPRYELFLGYSYLRAVPTLAAGNRLVWMNGGSTSSLSTSTAIWESLATLAPTRTRRSDSRARMGIPLT
jgi:hypothetical protein